MQGRHFTNTTTTSSQKDFIQRTLCRSTIASQVKSIPLYNATKSLLSKQVKSTTQHAFTPVIPYPATEQGTIYTCMKNVQDVLIQKNIEYGPLWSDEGVYRISKEIQILKAHEFKNIFFLGLGGFRTEKIIVACCGQYLEESGIDTVLVENKIFGIDVVKSVMNGKHYSHRKRGMMLISEAILQIILSEFSKESNEKQQNFQQLYQQVETLQNIIVNNFENDDLIKKEWYKCEQLSDKYVTLINEFISQGNRSSHLFKYWSNFLINVVTVLREFRLSFRQANWLKHAGSEKSNTTLLCF